jgi:hypothetical protein
VEKATPLMIEGEGGSDAALPLFYIFHIIHIGIM